MQRCGRPRRGRRDHYDLAALQLPQSVGVAETAGPPSTRISLEIIGIKAHNNRPFKVLTW